MNIEHTIQMSQQTGLSKLVDRDSSKKILSFANNYINAFYSTRREPRNAEIDFLLFVALQVGSCEKISDEDKVKIFTSYNELARRYDFTPIDYRLVMK